VSAGNSFKGRKLAWHFARPVVESAGVIGRTVFGDLPIVQGVTLSIDTKKALCKENALHASFKPFDGLMGLYGCNHCLVSRVQLDGEILEFSDHVQAEHRTALWSVNMSDQFRYLACDYVDYMRSWLARDDIYDIMDMPDVVTMHRHHMRNGDCMPDDDDVLHHFDYQQANQQILTRANESSFVKSNPCWMAILEAVSSAVSYRTPGEVVRNAAERILHVRYLLERNSVQPMLVNLPTYRAARDHMNSLLEQAIELRKQEVFAR